VADPEGNEADGEGDGEGVGGGFGGRLASTAAVLPMTSARARTAAIWTLIRQGLITLRIGRLPRTSNHASLPSSTSRGGRPVSAG
jgi:hypothetical protein